MVDWNNINQRVLLKEEEYTNFKNLRIFCGTYNVNGKSPDEYLSPWLCLDEDISIYAIGFQEIVDLSTTSLLLKTDWVEKEESWTKYVTNELTNKKNFKNNPNYKLISKIRMFGLYLLVFASDKLLKKNAITEIITSYVATGILTVGNKGSIAVSLKIHETRVCFVCSHFASDVDKLEKRNSDYRSTRQNLKFQFDQDQNSNNYIDLDQHDIIFWFGDLNYRIDSISLTETLELINSSNFDELIKYDQLSNERKKSRVFEYYEEGKIKFRPTYKYLVKSDIYEKQAMIQQLNLNSIDETKNFNNANINDNSNAKLKLPSWTDRILYKSSNLQIQLLKYICVNTLTISDHKPVSALFDIQVKKINQNKLKELIQAEMKESDRKFNEQMPYITLEKIEYKFEDCTFYDRKSLIMMVKNEGLTKSNVDIIFHDSIIKNDDNDVVSQKNNDDLNSLIHRKVNKSHELSQWVNISPVHKERVEPNASFIVEITTNFSSRILNRFNRERLIEDFLIVRCLNGNDKFATISCNYKPTIMGISIKALTTLNEKNESFEECNQTNLIHNIEHEIDEYEKNLNLLFSLNIKNFTTLVQRENAAKFILNNNINEEPINRSSKLSSQIRTSASITNIEHSPSLPQSMLQVYKRTFQHMKEDIIDRDKYFHNDLSSEYEFLMQHLINRCNENLKSTFNLSPQRDSVSSQQSQSDESNFTIEEQKNLALFFLSSKKFEDFVKSNFELELIAEILNDLLISLPQPLIPIRYLDFCSYTDKCYEEASNLIMILPKSHLKLFEMIIKFLQVYLKCLSSCDTNFHNILADSIFHLNPSFNNGAKNDITLIENRSSNKFLKLFIDNHTNFKYI